MSAQPSLNLWDKYFLYAEDLDALRDAMLARLDPERVIEWTSREQVRTATLAEYLAIFPDAKVAECIQHAESHTQKANPTAADVVEHRRTHILVNYHREPMNHYAGLGVWRYADEPTCIDREKIPVILPVAYKTTTRAIIESALRPKPYECQYYDSGAFYKCESGIVGCTVEQVPFLGKNGSCYVETADGKAPWVPGEILLPFGALFCRLLRERHPQAFFASPIPMGGSI